MDKENGKIWQLIFDPDSRLYSIKDWESKIDHFRHITSKINRVFEKTYTNIHAKFQSDRWNLFRVIVRQKKDTRIGTHTYTDIFWKHLIFYVDHMCVRETVNIELRILPPNQCFTQSKIEKAILNFEELLNNGHCPFEMIQEAHFLIQVLFWTSILQPRPPL